MVFESKYMNPETQISLSPSNRPGKIRNASLAVAASLPLLVPSAAEVSAAPGQSATTSEQKGPKCVEIFNQGDFDPKNVADVAKLLHFRILNAVRAHAAGETGDSITLDCTIWPGSGDPEVASANSAK